MKVIGSMVIKNEWPLAAVSISYALINHVDKMYVVDNGSQDGTWQGIKILQKLFPERLVVIYYESDVFNQQAISHALGHLISSQHNEEYWVLAHDADEFLVTQFSDSLGEYLEVANNQWNSIFVPVENYIPPMDFQDDNLDLYAQIEYQVALYSLYGNAREFNIKARAGEVYWQQYKTEGKVAYNKVIHKRIAHGSHQVLYGDAIRWVAHDSGTASSTTKNLFYLAHLPYTSKKRLSNRTKLRHSEKEGEPGRFFKNDQDTDITKFLENMTINKESKLFADSLAMGNVTIDNVFSDNILSVFPVLGPRWREIVSAPSVRNESSNQQFALLVDMAAGYIDIADRLWRENR